MNEALPVPDFSQGLAVSFPCSVVHKGRFRDQLNRDSINKKQNSITLQTRLSLICWRLFE